jgi:hypothetical protein
MLSQDEQHPGRESDRLPLQEEGCYPVPRQYWWNYILVYVAACLPARLPGAASSSANIIASSIPFIKRFSDV